MSGYLLGTASMCCVLQEHDPITRNGGGVPLLQPAIKLGVALAVLFVSFMSFAQSGRLYSHVVGKASPSSTAPYIVHIAPPAAL